MQRTELESIADQYRSDGYDVILAPAQTDLPQFLQRHEIDMLARRGDEQVVIEVKKRSDLNSEKELAYLAAEVNARPGWRFDLFVINGNPWADDVAGDSSEPDAERIRSLADSAERLLDQGELEASCLMAWSAVEASLRDVAQRAAISLERMTPQYVLTALVTEGILSREEYESIQSAYRIRNSVAHGLHAAGLTTEMSDSIIQTARRLLDLQPTASDA